MHRPSAALQRVVRHIPGLGPLLRSARDGRSHKKIITEEGPSAYRGTVVEWSRSRLLRESLRVFATFAPSKAVDGAATAHAVFLRRQARTGSDTRDRGARNVVVLCEPGGLFCAALLGTWLGGRMAVPVSYTNPPAELAYVLRDSGAGTILCTSRTRDIAFNVRRLAESRARVVVLSPSRLTSLDATTTPHLSAAAIRFNDVLRGKLHRYSLCPSGMDALMIYTSGTTGRPKGVVHTFASVSNQVAVLLEAWRWTPADRLLNFLPLHHVHGLVNATLCPIAAGATCVFAHPFDAAFVSQRIAAVDRPITVFMAVPPAYVKLLEFFRTKGTPTERAAFEHAAATQVRLFISGSSALPPSTRAELERELLGGGHRILERYGMTEIGMALSQPYEPVSARITGSVGFALPTVKIALRDASSSDPHITSHHSPPEFNEGELLVSSPSVFDRYWGRPQATQEAFSYDTESGIRWFKTGDAVTRDAATSQYRISGRLSVDVFKVLAFKVSALDVETALLDSGMVSDVAVFAKHRTDASDAIGDVLVAAVVLRATTTSTTTRDIQPLQKYAHDNLESAKRPREWVVLDALPRNAMGKVNKKDLAQKYAAGELK